MVLAHLPRIRNSYTMGLSTVAALPCRCQWDHGTGSTFDLWIADSRFKRQCRWILQFAGSAGVGEVPAAGAFPGISSRQWSGGCTDVRQRLEHFCPRAK